MFARKLFVFIFISVFSNSLLSQGKVFAKGKTSNKTEVKRKPLPTKVGADYDNYLSQRSRAISTYTINRNTKSEHVNPNQDFKGYENENKSLKNPRVINREAESLLLESRKKSKDGKGSIDREIGNTNKNTKEKQTFKIPKVSSREADNENKFKTFFGFGGSLIAYGNVGIEGRETPKQDDTQLSTFSSHVAYLPSFSANIRIGKSIPIFITNKSRSFYRLEFELEYSRLNGRIGTIEPASDYPSGNPDYPATPTFGLPANYGSVNLFNLSFNGLLDIGKFGPGYPYIGAGVGFGVMYFEKDIYTALVAPTFNIFIGYLFTISKKVDMSIGYKLTMLYSTNYTNDFIVPINGSTSRPVSTNEVDFGLMFIHKLEVVFWIF